MMQKKKTDGTGRAVLDTAGVDSRDNNICIQAFVWEQCACTKMGKHGTGDQTQGSHIQQVSGGGSNAV